MKRACVCFFLMFSLSGCGLSFEAPSDLIKTPITSEQDYKNMEVIRSFLNDDEKIEMPQEMKNPTSNIDIDIDGDGKNEKIVFFVKKNGYQTGINLLSENADGKWSLVYQDKQVGRSIKYFDLYDINGDGNLEMLLGVNVGGYYNLYIYGISQDRLQVIDQIKYSKIRLLKQGHKGSHIITSLNNKATDELTTELNVYEWKKGKMQNIFSRTYDGFTQQIEVGKVSKDKQGIYLGLSSDFDTVEYVLLLNNANTYEEKAHLESQYALSFSERANGFIGDVLGDGELAILSVIPPLDTTKRQVQDFLQVWKVWDENQGFKNHCAFLENTSDGYRLKLPVSWLKNLSYQYSLDRGISQISFYDKSKAVSTQPVFSIQTIENFSLSHSSAIDGLKVLGASTSNNRVYIARFYQSDFSGEKIDEETLKKLLTIEGGK